MQVIGDDFEHSLANSNCLIRSIILVSLTMVHTAAAYSFQPALGYKAPLRMEDNTDIFRDIHGPTEVGKLKNMYKHLNMYRHRTAPSPPRLYIDVNRKALTRHLIPVSQINHGVRCTRVQQPLVVELSPAQYLMM